jgi:hypothetical protein
MLQSRRLTIFSSLLLPTTVNDRKVDVDLRTYSQPVYGRLAVIFLCLCSFFLFFKSHSQHAGDGMSAASTVHSMSSRIPHFSPSLASSSNVDAYSNVKEGSKPETSTSLDTYPTPQSLLDVKVYNYKFFLCF